MSVCKILTQNHINDLFCFVFFSENKTKKNQIKKHVLNILMKRQFKIKTDT